MFLRIDEPAPAAAESPTNGAQPGSTTNEELNSSASNAGNLTDLERYRRGVLDAVTSYERQTRMLSELRRNMAVPDMHHLQTDEVVRDEAARLYDQDESAPTREQHEETARRADERVMEEYQAELVGRLGQQPPPGFPPNEAAWGDTAWYRHQNELEMTRQLHESLSRMAPRLSQDRDIREYQKALLSSLPPREPAPASPEPEEQDGVVGRDHIQRHYTDEEFLRICEDSGQLTSDIGHHHHSTTTNTRASDDDKMATIEPQPPESALDARVEDYLEDKLQSAADLDSLDALLETVALQRTQLQTQLDAAARDLDAARRTTDDRHGLIQERIAAFRALQASIDERVRATAASDAPAAAIARLQRPMQKRRAVELARQYLVLLQDVERLRREARVHLPASPKAALEPYAQLKELALTLRGLPGSEALHLVDHVEAVTESLWAEMKQIMSDELEAVLKARGWPRVDPQSEMDDEWIACVEKLVDIQRPEILHSPEVVPLLPVDVMAHIFIAEFRFHFLSDKPTSKAQSMGSHCFPWFLSIVEKWEDFFRDNLAPVLAAKFHDTPVADRTVYADPVCALVTSLLTVMREKVHAVAAEAVGNPPFLSTFIGQLISFDDAVRSRFNYDGGDAEHGWPGLTAEVLADHFEVWFAAERAFALERFETILDAPDARKIDYDYAVAGKMKPTFAAVRVADLLRTITTKYERLRSLKYKVRFLTRIQLDILDGYHERLKGSLEAYQSMTSALGRTLHGATKEQLAALEGLGALETLCKVIGSADHIANALTEWGDEEFFTELWDELQTSSGSSGSSELEGEQDITSSKGQNGAIFDETIAAYSSRRRAAEEILVSTLADAHAKAFRAYTQRPQWTTIGDADTLDPSQLSITAELDLPLSKLKQNFDFSCRALSSASYRRVWHGALGKLQDLLWHGVLMKHHFTTLGAVQFAHDGQALAAVLERHLPGASSALEELREAMELLRLPITLPEEGGVTLRQASERAFADNDAARALLEEMQLQSLTPVNARHVLQRRVENNENTGW